MSKPQQSVQWLELQSVWRSQELRTRPHPLPDIVTPLWVKTYAIVWFMVMGISREKIPRLVEAKLRLQFRSPGDGAHAKQDYLDVLVETMRLTTHDVVYPKSAKGQLCLSAVFRQIQDTWRQEYMIFLFFGCSNRRRKIAVLNER